MKPWALLLAALPSLAGAQSPPPERLHAVIDLVAERYREPLSTEDLETRALQAFLEKLDPYSTYYDASAWADYEGGFTGGFAGLGVMLDLPAGQSLPTIAQLFIGAGAADAGLRRGDVLVAADGHAFAGLSIEAITDHLRGTPGTAVTVTWRRSGDPREHTTRVVRRRIETPSVRGLRRDAGHQPDFVLDARHRLGYVRILKFADDTLVRVRGALTQLQGAGMSGLVLDLRGSIGGKMQVALDTADLFLDNGRMVGAIRRGDTTYFDAKPGVLTTVPIVLLIDGETVSSSEIFAGALIDNQRATAVGARSFGKGRIQEKIALPPGQGGIVLTTGVFQRPNGRTFDKHDPGHAGDAGIAPAPEHQVVLTAEEQAAWLADMDRLDGHFALTPDEQDLRQPDRILARGQQVLLARLAMATEKLPPR